MDLSVIYINQNCLFHNQTKTRISAEPMDAPRKAGICIHKWTLTLTDSVPNNI